VPAISITGANPQPIFERIKGENIRTLVLVAGVRQAQKAVCVAWDEDKYTVEEIFHHIIAHEIHHIGQLSVWSREIELTPVPANFIGRKFKSIHSY